LSNSQLLRKEMAMLPNVVKLFYGRKNGGARRKKVGLWTSYIGEGGGAKRGEFLGRKNKSGRVWRKLWKRGVRPPVVKAEAKR